LNYCLDDGSTLVDGPGSGEAQTELFSSRNAAIDLPSRSRTVSKTIPVLVLVLALLGVGGYWYLNRSAPGKTSASNVQNDNYVRAKVLIGNENRDDIDAAIKLLQQSVADDPQFAAGWAQLARALNKKAFYYATNDERKQLNEDAEVAVNKSLTIDPNLAEGHFARGLILWTHAKRFPHELAIQSYKRALALDPTLDEAHHQLGLVYLHIGLFDKAQAEIAKTLEINPANSLARFRYGVIDLHRGRYEDAYEFFRSSTPAGLSPSLVAFQEAIAAFKLGRADEAMDIIDKYLNENPVDEGGLGASVKAMVLAQKGKTDEALEAIKHAEEIGHDFGHFHHTAYNIAMAYALMNKPDKAVDYLQLAADDGFPCYPLFESDESFSNMRQNTRYVALLAKLKQQWDRYNATL
jgi:tetratricopeptide (TPR) repeat protein